jgi:hypothetical protein
MEHHIVGRPQGAERVAAGGEFADEVSEPTFVGVAAGFGAQDGDHVLRGGFPIAVELAAARAEEGEPRRVRRPDRVIEHWRVQRAAETVHGKDVGTAVADPCWCVDGAEHPLQTRTDLLR